ncbi:MAG: hypothetical protein JXM70_01275, partial [Pirellulales bacterium]|nr:hypothetical protein [Pirellulales bacterium]
MTSPKPGGKSAETKPQPLWHKSAPKSVCELDRKLDSKKPRDIEAYRDAQKAWAKYLRKRKDPLPLAKLLPGKTHPLTWALPRDFIACTSVAQASDDSPKFDLADEEQIRQWLDSGPGDDEGADIAHALETLAWCHALPRLAESEAWWELLERL